MKKILIATFVIFITSAYLNCAALPNRTVIRQQAHQFDGNFPINYTTLKTVLDMQHAFESEPDIITKNRFITLLLAENVAETQNGITILEKISYLINLRKIIKSNISLYSGWIWNEPENEEYIQWLKTQLNLINETIKKLEWQAASFGYKATVKTATLMSYYLAAVFLAYAAQYQYAQSHNLSPENDISQIAVLPITSMIDLAKKINLQNLPNLH